MYAVIVFIGKSFDLLRDRENEPIQFPDYLAAKYMAQTLKQEYKIVPLGD